MPEDFKQKHRPPCHHMEPVLNDIASGRASRIKRLFAWLHMIHCGPCRRFMDSLKEMVSQLSSAKTSEHDDEALARLAATVRRPES